ncbi:MAG: hypothetical protein ACTSRZ_16490 [Promethearchaeota archaeon]
MNISAELTYYPLGDMNYRSTISKIIYSITNKIKQLNKTQHQDGIKHNNSIIIEYTSMSTIIFGEYKDVIKIINEIIEEFFSKYDSILEVKYSNACKKE